MSATPLLADRLTSTAHALLAGLADHPFKDTPRLILRDCLMDDGSWDWPTVRAIVLDRPECDGRRLLAADWFEDEGERERAEFVRVQCDLARLKPNWAAMRAGCLCDTCQKAAPLADRERELWNASRLNGAPHPWFGQMGFRHTANWLTTYDKPEMTIPLGRNRDRRCRFSIARGFIDSLTLSAADWLAHGDAILAEHPVTTVTLSRWLDWARDNMRVINPTAAMGLLSSLVTVYLGRRWPRVRTWTLPPQPLGDVPDDGQIFDEIANAPAITSDARD